MSDRLEFIGEPFDPSAWTAPEGPETRPVTRLAPPPPAFMGQTTDDDERSALAKLREAFVLSHINALRGQARLQLRLCAPLRNRTRPHSAPRGADELAFKPLARCAVTRLGPEDLARLAGGDAAAVFGASHDSGGCNPDVRLAAAGPLVLTEVTGLCQRCDGRGRMSARIAPGADITDATAQAAQVFALYSGLHLCLADATFVRIDEQHTRIEPSEATESLEMDFEVEQIDLVPRPWLRVNARLGNVRVRNVAVALHEKPGVPIGPARGGIPTRWLGRKSSLGEPVLLNEFHMTHLARGDQGIAFGPEYAHYTGRKTTRLPAGGLLLLDRVVAVEGHRGQLEGGTLITEYDSPTDAWYYGDTANHSMPNCIYMEVSSQAALISGYYFGATLPTPEAELGLRQLGGTATLLQEVDLRGATIRQTSNVLSTTVASGSTLQSFSFTQTVNGVPLYTGESLFGYFSDATLASQTGLDSGRTVPTWLEAERPRSGVHTIDVAARRADPTARRIARNHLALLDQVTVVDHGGRYGNGYLHAQRPIDPEDTLFDWHFVLDPVMPGSFGVESVIQAMQEWLLAVGLDDGLHEPDFILPVGVPFTWKYRGQLLCTDRTSTLEVHLKRIQRSPGRVRVTADASLWKPGLRIYEMTDISVELRESGAAPW
jgi:3-hydroxymyristoyl/3-hydroxydecanoyl-(acyl carrier protein) dehydratase